MPTRWKDGSIRQHTKKNKQSRRQRSEGMSVMNDSYDYNLAVQTLFFDFKQGV